MASNRATSTQLRDRLLSQSPDPMKTSILRESNMGWNSPPSSPKTGANAITSPLRINKRDSSPNLRPTQADLARRSSSSYRHMRNNNLVTKSPFKSQIPTPSTPSRQPAMPISSPTRRVSGEKRPRPPSMHDEAETENDRPFSLKRERKQSKTFQGLIEREPVTKSPFRQVQAKEDLPRKPSPPPVPTSRIPMSTGSPVRPSLVTKRMHGPRLSGVKRERRKTVTFDERCDVLEFTPPDEDTSGEVFESDEEDDYGDGDQDDADSFFDKPREAQQERSPHDSYEDIESLNREHDRHLELDADTSITGLVDEMFAGSRQTSTPPRQHSRELPSDLETEDGVPLGRSHHAERAMKFHQEHDSLSHSGLTALPISQTSLFSLHATATSPPPSTPSHRRPISSPPLGRSTHLERLQSARQEEEDIDKDVKMLPESPSPIKPTSRRQPNETGTDGLVPRFELPGHTPVADDHHSGSDPFAMPSLKDEPLPPDAGSFIQEDSIVSNATIDHSEVNISALEQQLGNEPIMNTSMETSPINQSSFTRSSSPVTAPARRSPLPPIPSAIPPRISSPAVRSTSPLSPRKSPSPFGSPNGIRPRINRDDVQRRLVRPRSFGSPSPSGSPKAAGDAAPSPRSSVDRQRIVDLSADLDFGLDHIDDKEQNVLNESQQEVEKDSNMDNSAEMATIETAEKRKFVPIGVVQQHEPMETDASMEVTHDVTMDMEDVKAEAVNRPEHVFTTDPIHVHSPPPEPIAVIQATELRDQSFSGDEVESGIDDDEEEAAGEEFGLLEAPSSANTNNKKLKFDFGSKFGLGKLGLSGMGLSTEDLTEPVTIPSTAPDTSASAPLNMGITKPATVSAPKMPVGSVNVRMDMRSALDRLMDDVAGAGGGSTLEEHYDISMASTEDGYREDVFRSLQRGIGLPSMQRAATESTVMDNLGHPGGNSGMASRSASNSSSIAPPVPPKDNIRTREAMILEKRRKMRRMEEGIFDDDDDDDDVPLGAPKAQLNIPVGRPSRRRSMSTGDAEDLGGGAKRRGAALRGMDSKLSLDSPTDSTDPLSDSIEKELKKNDEGPEKRKKRYLIREHQGTIYASSQVSHMAGPGDVNTGKAWRTVRRPSDMNEYAQQIREFREQEKPGKAYGKVFVKVLGIRGLVVPIPDEQTAVSCTLNNGIHFVTTPDFRLGKECRIEQEFELIEHSKLEFTLTLKVRRDPHIIAQFKAVVPPRPPQPPPMVSNPSSSSSKSSGMRSFFHSSPKKNKDKRNTPPAPAPAPQLPPPRLTENLARYLKPDGSLARAFISFKDIASRCDTRLFETSFPLIGQRVELGNKFSTLQVGELILQMFRLPPLPGLPPESLPQSLEECHRGLRHVNWHKMTYLEGTLTQNGGDCSSWRRRQLRIIGSNLVAFNDVTKRVTATINLRNAVAVEDNQDPRKDLRSPASGASRYRDEYDSLFGVERSFRLVFPEEEILFFADSDEEKAKWLEVLRALVGHIPPHPLWAELLWQRQEDTNKVRKAQPQSSSAPAPNRRS